MPIIKDLKRFLRRNQWFKVIEASLYERRWYGLAHEVHVVSFSEGVEVTVLYGDWLFGTREEKLFSSLDDAIKWIMQKFPPSMYVYYKPRFSEHEDFINVRNLLGLTIDEGEAWKVILARVMGHLNGRRLLGFKVLRNTSKKCSRCDRKAAILLVFDYHGKRYGVYYCREHFIRAVYAVWANLVKKAGRIKDGMLRLVEQPITKDEEKELLEYLIREDEDIHYLKELGVIEDDCCL